MKILLYLDKDGKVKKDILLKGYGNKEQISVMLTELGLIVRELEVYYKDYDYLKGDYH